MGITKGYRDWILLIVYPGFSCWHIAFFECFDVTFGRMKEIVVKSDDDAMRIWKSLPSNSSRSAKLSEFEEIPSSHWPIKYRNALKWLPSNINGTLIHPNETD